MVVGASGYIGSHLVSRLLEKGAKVVGIDEQSSLFPSVPEYRHIRSDIRSIGQSPNAISGLQISGIYHLATSSAMPESFNSGQEYLDTELQKCNAVTQIARSSPDCKFVAFSSSCSVYGNVLHGEVPETTEVSPMSPYASAKVMSEQFLRRDLGQTSVRLAVFRFFNVVGRDPASNLRERHVPETHLLPNAIAAATQGKSIEVYGLDFENPDGSAIRDYVDVRDLVNGLIEGCDFLLFSKRENDIWNLASNQPHSVLEVIAKVEKATQKKIGVSVLERRPGDPARAVADCQKAQRDGFWKPKFSLEDSIASLLA